VSWTLRITAAAAVLGVAAIGWLLATTPSFTAYDFVSGADAEPPDDSGTYVEMQGYLYEKREVECASVLAGPPSDQPNDRAAAAREYDDVSSDDESPGPTEDDPGRDEGRDGDDWLAGDCDRLRQQRLGFAVLAGAVPLLVGGVAAFSQLHQLTRAAAHAGPDSSWSDLLARARGEGGAHHGGDGGTGSPPDPADQGANSPDR
jgi:hypothetical protein